MHMHAEAPVRMRRTFRRWERNIGVLLGLSMGAEQASRFTGTLGRLACMLCTPGVPPCRPRPLSGILCYLYC